MARHELLDGETPGFSDGMVDCGVEHGAPPGGNASLAKLSLPDGYLDLAMKMDPVVRDLVVFNRKPSSVPINTLLAALGMPPVEERAAPPSYPGLRSLALLSLLPKPTGEAADVIRESEALTSTACAQLRSAVDAASFAACDSVDGCLDYQLNLSRGELEALVGVDAVQRLWALAAHTLRRLRPGEYEDDEEEEVEEEEEEEGADDGEEDGEVAAGAADGTIEPEGTVASDSAAGRRAAALLEAHEIFVRVYTGDTRPWFPFHSASRCLERPQAHRSDATAKPDARLAHMHACRQSRWPCSCCWRAFDPWACLRVCGGAQRIGLRSPSTWPCRTTRSTRVGGSSQSTTARCVPSSDARGRRRCTRRASCTR